MPIDAGMIPDPTLKAKIAESLRKTEEEPIEKDNGTERNPLIIQQAITIDNE